MEDGDEMSEKTEKATPWKLQKAKEQGRVNKSTELNTCVFLFVLLGVAMALWPYSLSKIKQLILHMFYLTNQLSFSTNAFNLLQQHILSTFIILWLPFALAGMLSIILSTMAQTGFVWSMKPLVPDMQRLHIMRGFKRLFSIKLLFDAGKNSLKLALACFVLYLNIKHKLPFLSTFIKTNPVDYPVLLVQLLSNIILQLLILLFALAFIDTLYTRWTFHKDNRMSKQEIKDDYRQREGCPKIKAKMKQLQYQLRQKTASLAQIETADVVITNPTHLAVVLKYERGLMPAPKVVCKAEGELVKQVKKLAQRHQIPIIENKPLARLLFATSDLNQWIAREHFPMVASIFRDIYRQRAMI